MIWLEKNSRRDRFMKRKLAWLLVVVMVLTSVPFTGFAETQPAEEMNFAEFLPEAAVVEEAVAQEAAEAVAAEEADAITDVEESELALAGEGQDGGQQSGGSGIEFEWDHHKSGYSIGVLNNNEVSINRILDNLQIDRKTEGCSVADAEIRQSGFYLLDKSSGQDIGEWKVNCGSGEPSNGILWVKLQNSSEFEINMSPSSSGGGQQGGGNGKVKFTLEGKEPKKYDLQEFNQGNVSIGRILDNFGLKEDGKSVKDAYMDGPSNYGIQKTDTAIWKIRPLDSGTSGTVIARYQNTNHEISVTRTGGAGKRQLYLYLWVKVVFLYRIRVKQRSGCEPWPSP